jgi:Jacalin-like lectin domain
MGLIKKIATGVVIAVIGDRIVNATNDDPSPTPNDTTRQKTIATSSETESLHYPPIPNSVSSNIVSEAPERSTYQTHYLWSNNNTSTGEETQVWNKTLSNGEWQVQSITVYQFKDLGIFICGFTIGYYNIYNEKMFYLYHGNTTGAEVAGELRFDDDEYLTGISIEHVNWLNSIKFHTNKEREVKFGGGIELDTQKMWRISEPDEEIIGFEVKAVDRNIQGISLITKRRNIKNSVNEPTNEVPVPGLR